MKNLILATFLLSFFITSSNAHADTKGNPIEIWAKCVFLDKSGTTGTINSIVKQTGGSRADIIQNNYSCGNNGTVKAVIITPKAPSKKDNQDFQSFFMVNITANYSRTANPISGACQLNLSVSTGKDKRSELKINSTNSTSPNQISCNASSSSQRIDVTITQKN